MQEAEEMMEGEDDDESESLVQKKKKKMQEDQREYVACLKCTHDCFYSPHSAASPASAPGLQLPPTAPSFLKVLDDPFSRCLEIPQTFVDACVSKCMREVKLEGPSGWVWYAPFVRDTDKNFGKAVLGSPGWDDFAHDHMLERGDLLVLTYFSVRQLFKVRIFDAAEGIEKSLHCLPSKPHYVSMSCHIVNQRNTSNMEPQVDDSENKGFIIESKGDSRKQIPADISGYKPLFQEPKNGASRPNGRLTNVRSGEMKTIKCCKCETEYDKERTGGHVAEIKESENQSLHGLACKTRTLTHKNGKSKPSASNEQEIYESFHLKASVPFKRGSEQFLHEKKLVYGGRYKSFPKVSRYDEVGEYDPRAIASPAERERVKNEAKAFHSKNPFLIKSLSASSIYKDRKLMWPKAFTDVYMPKRNAWMTWVDAEGKQWNCLWLPQRGYNTSVSFISAGWSAFALSHHLIQHDVCIFELIDQDAMFFHVHIFKQRAGLLPTQLFPPS